MIHPDDLPLDLAGLVASRICHDLISPLGAIGNGVELLQMSDGGDGSEVALIAQSVENAQARIRFFRVAFGTAGPDQVIAHHEVVSTLAATARGGRLSYFWEPEQALARVEVRIAFLALLCLETAMAYGGDVHVRRNAGTWDISGESERLRALPELWGILGGTAAPVTAAQVQFAMLGGLVQDSGRRLTVTQAPTRIGISF